MWSQMAWEDHQNPQQEAQAGLPGLPRFRKPKSSSTSLMLYKRLGFDQGCPNSGPCHCLESLAHDTAAGIVYYQLHRSTKTQLQTTQVSRRSGDCSPFSLVTFSHGLLDRF